MREALHAKDEVTISSVHISSCKALSGMTARGTLSKAKARSLDTGAEGRAVLGALCSRVLQDLNYGTQLRAPLAAVMAEPL